MKLFRNILLAGIFTTTLYSCDRNLDIVQEGSLTQQTFWKTEQDLISAANSLYQPTYDSEFYGRGLFWFINASDDMVTGRTRSESDNVKNFNKAYVGGGLDEQWKPRYQIIGRANEILRKADGINTTTAIKKKYKGEALFMSSRMYFELASNYGDAKMGVPIVNKNELPDIKPIPRAANVTENYKYIAEDLKLAIEYLPYQSELPTSDYGRPHKVAAMGLLAKVYLFMEDYVNAEFWANEVMTKGNRALLSNYQDVFKAENNYSSEYVWSVIGTPKFTSWGSILPGVMLENKGWGEYNGWGYFHPTKELYDEFENGDNRRGVTILKTGDSFVFNGTTRVYSSTNSRTGYQFNKYMDAFKYKLDGTHVSTDPDYPCTDLAVPLMRYAEVILIKAEAKIKQGKNADVEINMIRNRAGLPNKTNCTMADLKHERRCELAGEWSDRHRDLVRWGDAQSVYALPLHDINGNVAWPARTFNPQIHHVWAIPLKEINNSNGVIKQNAGW